MSSLRLLRGYRHRVHPLRSGMLMGLLLVLPGAAQYTPSKSQFPSQQAGPAQNHSIDGFGDNDPFANEQRLRALNESRHKSVVRDTQKLLELATELNSEIQATNPDTLTPAQLRQWREIEKLAHHVKDNMRDMAPEEPVEAPPAPPPGR